MPYNKLTQEIKKRLSKLPYVDAFYIHGSRGVGRHTSTSDMDYTVLVKSRKYEKEINEELKDLLKFESVPGFYGDDYWQVCEWRETGDDIGWHIMETKYFKTLIRNIFKNKKNLLELQDDAQFFIIEADPVYDPNKLIASWKRELNKYPNKLADEVLSDRIKKLETKIWWLGGYFRNPFHFIENMHEIIKFIAQAHYAKNKAFLMNSMKRWHQNMENFKPDLKKELDLLVKIDKKLPKEDKRVPLKKIVAELKS